MSLRFYPACIERAEAGISVFFPDLPGCIGAKAVPIAWCPLLHMLWSRHDSA
jgi:hypothetical protein